VVLVKKAGGEELFACKAMGKKGAIDSLQVEHALNERNILFACASPHIVKLYDYLQDRATVRCTPPTCAPSPQCRRGVWPQGTPGSPRPPRADQLFLVLEYCSGGELLQVLRKARNGCLGAEQTRFAAAQMTAALEYLHNVDVVYRDLKPENVRDVQQSAAPCAAAALSSPDWPGWPAGAARPPRQPSACRLWVCEALDPHAWAGYHVHDVRHRRLHGARYPPTTPLRAASVHAPTPATVC
jgi:hypothetical protein